MKLFAKGGSIAFAAVLLFLVAVQSVGAYAIEPSAIAAMTTSLQDDVTDTVTSVVPAVLLIGAVLISAFVGLNIVFAFAKKGAKQKA